MSVLFWQEFRDQRTEDSCKEVTSTIGELIEQKI